MEQYNYINFLQVAEITVAIDKIQSVIKFEFI